MDRKQIMKIVKNELPAKRWAHTEGVMKTAVKLAKKYGADPAKADLAALIHDYVKYWPVEKMRTFIISNGLVDPLLLMDWELWHAPLASFIANKDFGVNDLEVLDAIRFHTSGRGNMTLLDKIICLADYMEPGRDFPEVYQIRELAKTSLEKALAAGFDYTLIYLIHKQKRIYPLTLLARNGLLQEMETKKRSKEVEK